MENISLAQLEEFDPRAKASGRERRFCCPFCGREKPMDAPHRSLSVNTESGAWNCHRCGASGKLKEHWEERDAPTAKARRYMETKRTFSTAPPPCRTAESDPDSVAGFKKQIRGIVAFAGSPAEAYLASRSISSEIAKSASCKYAPNWGRIGAAVIFPIKDELGKAVAAAGRAIEGDGKQTFGPKSLGIFSTFGALDADPVAIVEAPIDALSLAFAGLPSVALCGCSGIAGWLANRLAKSVRAGVSRTVYLAFDADSAGDAAADKIENQLPLVRCVRLRPDGAKDWNALLLSHGLEHLRAQLPANTSSPILSECMDCCEICGSSVKLVPYPDGGGWCWYECANCGNTGTKNPAMQ